MARTTQISKEKQQSFMTLRHEDQSIRKMSRTLKVSSSAVSKTMKLYDETGSHEDHHRKGRPRVSSTAEDKFITVNCIPDCSPNKYTAQKKGNTKITHPRSE